MKRLPRQKFHDENVHQSALVTSYLLDYRAASRFSDASKADIAAAFRRRLCNKNISFSAIFM